VDYQPAQYFPHHCRSGAVAQLSFFCGLLRVDNSKTVHKLLIELSVFSFQLPAGNTVITDNALLAEIKIVLMLCVAQNLPNKMLFCFRT
jgi:hypothetical protein